MRLVHVQIIEHGKWSHAAAAIQERVIEMAPRRGAIYDRNGVILAFDVKARAIAIDSFNMTKPVELTRILSEELGVSASSLVPLVYRSSYFTWIDRQVDLDVARRIQEHAEAIGAHGLLFLDTWKRHYPQGRLASNLIGFVGTDGDGLEGLELTFDEELRGIPSRVRVLEGGDGRTYEVRVLDEGTPGQDLHLTLDATLQLVCEEVIERRTALYQADAGMAVVLDPETGDVLAMAQDKRYNLNRFSSSTTAQRRNLAVTYMFEPGSIFKVFTGLSALEAGVVRPTDTFAAGSSIRVAGTTMRNADSTAYGTVTFARIIAESINTGMIQVAQRLEKERLYETLTALGFGVATGIELPGEVEGILRPTAQWTELDLAAASIGQSVAVTAIQLARGLSIVANGGLWVEPRIVFPAASAPPHSGSEPARAIADDACATMRELMVGVVEHGTGGYAALDGFTIAGKTGTAQKAVPGQGYVDGRYTSLFAGMVPALRPEFVLLVVFDEVKYGPTGGGSTAAPAFRDILERWAGMGRIAADAG
ncbi:MAG: penicillin-binding protein 2 [Candidatus Bipolaricaulota bacterium]